MAVYVTSDLHGFSLPKFKQLLKVIGFTYSDWLYIIGDVIDRNNDGGVEMLLWLLEQPNVELLLGNHEQMMLACSWAFRKITDEEIAGLSTKKLDNLNVWMSNGAGPTIESLKGILKTSPDTIDDILDYLNDAPICEGVEVNGKSFILCHGGFKNFDKNKKLSEYTKKEILWNRPNIEDRYFDDITTILGHTPTVLYSGKRKAFHTDTWIDIDVGAGSGYPPMFLRLDDMKEFYF